MTIYSLDDLRSILPITFVVGWACVLLLVDVFFKRKGLTFWLAILGLGGALYFAIRQSGTAVTAFNEMLSVDGFAVFLYVIVLASGLLAVFLAYDYLKRMDIFKGEYFVLMFFSIAGIMLMASAADLIVVFLALELLSIPLYILAAFARPNPESEEAGMKYFLLGAFAGGFVLYGVALVYGATGETGLKEIVNAFTVGVENPTFLLIGSALILIGLGFKVAAVPFHMWTPDVYQGAPTPVTAFMAVGAKVGGFAALLRVFIVAFPALSENLVPVIGGIATLTLVVGNFVAIAQKNIKRMLAYSSISHAGFILMAFITYGEQAVYVDAVAAALFYLLTFSVTSFGAWGVVIALERAEGKGLALADYAGLGKKHPGLALAMLVFMLSFTGVPPTLGFAGKFYLFKVVLEGGYVWLAVVGVLTSLISAYYYLRVVIIMYMQEGSPVVQREPLLNLTTMFAAVGTVVLFFVSGPLFSWASASVLQLF